MLPCRAPPAAVPVPRPAVPDLRFLVPGLPVPAQMIRFRTDSLPPARSLQGLPVPAAGSLPVPDFLPVPKTLLPDRPVPHLPLPRPDLHGRLPSKHQEAAPEAEIPGTVFSPRVLSIS